MSIKKDISKAMSHIGSIKTKKKAAASRENIKKAIAARKAPEGQLAKAYYQVTKGMGMTEACTTIAKCRYVKFKAYCKKRDAESEEVGL